MALESCGLLGSRKASLRDKERINPYSLGRNLHSREQRSNAKGKEFVQSLYLGVIQVVITSIQRELLTWGLLLVEE